MLTGQIPETASRAPDPPAVLRQSAGTPGPRRRYLRLVTIAAIAIMSLIVAAMGAVIWQLRQNSITNAVTEISKLNHVLAEHADHSLQSIDLLLTSIEDDLTDAGPLDADQFRRAATSYDVYQSIRQKLSGLPQVYAVALINADGALLAVTRSFPIQSVINVADRDYFLAMRDHPEMERYISAPVESRATGRQTIYVARRINRLDKSFAGLVVAAVETRYFEDFYRDVYPGEGSIISLWRKDGTPLARYPSAENRSGIAFVQSKPFRDTVTSGVIQEVWTSSRALHGDVAVALRPLRTYPLIATVARRQSAILASWRSQAIVVATSAGALALAIAFVAWLMYRQFIAEEQVTAARVKAAEETEARHELQRVVAQAEGIRRKLEQSEARFRDIAEVAADIIWETDRDHRFTIFMNDGPNGAKLMEGRNADTYGRTRWEFAGADPKSDEIWLRHKEELDARRPFRNFHYSRITLQGTTQYFCVSGKPIFDESGIFCGYRGTATDETAMILAQQRAQRADALLLDAVNSISEGFVIYDEEDRLVLCNEAYRNLYPESAPWLIPSARFEDILRHGLANGQYPAAREHEEEWLAERVRKHRQLSEEHEQPLSDGRWVLVSERRMSNGGTAGLRIDITGLKAIQTSLRESQALLNQAQRISNTGSAVRDFGTTNPIWSDQMYTIFGVTRDNFSPTTQGFLNLVHPEDRALAAASIEASRNGIKTPPLQYRIVRPDGTLRWVHREVEIIFDSDGTPIGQASTFKDITEQRDAERRQAALEIQLQHSQRLEGLGTLAGGIAHDLNNTLVPILALSKLALQILPADTPIRDDLSMIVTASQRARDLVRQILAFSRKQDLVKQKIELREITQEALQILRAGLPSTIRLNENFVAVPSILGDPGQLQQVIVNLVANAAHAIGERPGTIDISLSPLPATAPSMASKVRLTVRDTGCGIDEAHLARIFEPFFTTKPVSEGTGLGLSVVHGIVTGHGGTIDVRSKPGNGTEFTIVLPITETSADLRPLNRSAA